MFICYTLLRVHSSFAITLMRKRKLVALLLLSYRCIVSSFPVLVFFPILLYVYRMNDSFTAQARPPFLYELLLLKVLSILLYIFRMADSFTAQTRPPFLYELLLLKVLSILLYVFRMADSFPV